MSAIGNKTKFLYIERVEVSNTRGRTTTTDKVLAKFKGVLSSVKHYGSGSRDTSIAMQNNVTYDYELTISRRLVPNLNEKNIIRDTKTNLEYEIQQVLIPDMNRGNVWVVQLLRIR